MFACFTHSASTIELVPLDGTQLTFTVRTVIDSTPILEKNRVCVYIQYSIHIFNSQIYDIIDIQLVNVPFIFHLKASVKLSTKDHY